MSNISEVDPAIEAAFFGKQISQSILMTLFGTMSLLDFWGLIEFIRSWRGKEKKIARDRETFWLRMFLFFISVFGCITLAIGTTMAFIVNPSPQFCDFLGRSVGLGYALVIQFGYLFLLQKAKLVGHFEKGKFYKTLMFLCQFGILTMVPLVLIPITAVFNYGAITAGGHCIQVCPVWISIFFLIANIFLSSVMIYLFVKPLLNVIHDSQEAMYKIGLRNARISGFAVFFTFCMVVTYMVLETLSQEGKVNQQYNCIALAAMLWDVFVLGASCKMTTNIWLPKKFLHSKVTHHSEHRSHREGAVVNVTSTPTTTPTTQEYH